VLLHEVDANEGLGFRVLGRFALVAIGSTNRLLEPQDCLLVRWILTGLDHDSSPVDNATKVSEFEVGWEAPCNFPEDKQLPKARSQLYPSWGR